METDFVPRYGGAQNDDDEEAKKREERERKKAEVRKRLEESGKAGKKQKKGFLTPERKKKLRKLLMMKAAEDLKQQQLMKEQERQKALQARIVALPDLESLNDHGALEKIYDDFFERLRKLEEEKFDINQSVIQKDAEINELTIAVNDLRGKFVKPMLKKVSKYDNKFKSKAATGEGGGKADFRANLKVVKKETDLDDLVKKKTGPDWSKDQAAPKAEKPKEEKKEEEPPAEAEAAEEPAPAEEAAPAEEPEEEEDGEEEDGEEEEEEE